MSTPEIVVVSALAGAGIGALLLCLLVLGFAYCRGGIEIGTREYREDD